MTQEVTSVLEEIVEGVGRVSQLIENVSQASGEQSRGVSEINTAVAQLDNVTQSNAANAEESASASEELSGQARELNVMVQVLAAIVNGGNANSSPTNSMSHSPKRSWKPGKKAATTQQSAGYGGAEISNIPSAAHSSTSVVIPLEEDEMIEI